MPSATAPKTKTAHPICEMAFFMDTPLVIYFYALSGCSKDELISFGRFEQRRSKRLIADDRAAPHDALQARLVESGGAVQRAAVVPHNALAWGPAVRIDARLWCDHPVELLDQRAAFRVIHAFDRLCMVAKENCLASGLRVGAHNRMSHGWHLGFLFSRQGILAVAARARKIEIMDGAAAFDPGLHRGGQQIVGGVHVDEFGFAALLRHDLRIHHGCLPRAL